jgi:ElaB/YqjD/DUF883 family membrane-anchored ribosome-binding protein
VSRADLTDLERDVELARDRFAESFARVGSPEAVGELKEDLLEAKDEVIHRAREAAQDTMSNFVTELKDRAAANPVAVAAIGAGLLWRVVHRPPIASLLIGLGAISLLRKRRINGAEDEFYVPGRETVQEAAEFARDKIQDFSEAAKVAAEGFGEKAEAAAQSLREGAKSAAHGIAEGAQAAAQQTISRVSDTTHRVIKQTSEFADGVTRDSNAKDNLLLGTAALAIGAAMITAYQRRNH